MPARFDIDDIVALPPGLYRSGRRAALFQDDTQSILVETEQHADLTRSESLDGKRIRLVKSQIALLGLSLKDEDNYMYTAQLVECRHKHWLPTDNILLAIPGNLIATASLLQRPLKAARPIPVRLPPLKKRLVTALRF